LNDTQSNPIKLDFNNTITTNHIDNEQNLLDNLIRKVNKFKTNPYEMWLIANGFERNKSSNVIDTNTNNGDVYVPFIQRGNKNSVTNLNLQNVNTNNFNMNNRNINDIRPTTVIHRNRTSPFNRMYNNNKPNRAESRDINSTSNNRNKRGRINNITND